MDISPDSAWMMKSKPGLSRSGPLVGDLTAPKYEQRSSGRLKLEAKRDMKKRLDEVVTDRVRRAHVILVAGADGTPMPIEPFYAVRDWVERHLRCSG